jgi:hypothetical protein
MGTPPDHRHAGQPSTRDALRSLQDLDDALTVAAADAAVVDATTADAGDTEDAVPPLSRAERRGARRRVAAGRRPGPATRNAPVPVKRQIGRGRDPRLPRR